MTQHQIILLELKEIKDNGVFFHCDKRGWARAINLVGRTRNGFIKHEVKRRLTELHEDGLVERDMEGKCVIYRYKKGAPKLK